MKTESNVYFVLQHVILYTLGICSRLHILHCIKIIGKEATGLERGKKGTEADEGFDE